MAVYMVVIVSNIFIMFALERFMRAFFEKRRTSILVFLTTYTAYPVIASSIYFLSSSPFLNLILTFISLFVITINYKSKLFMRLVAVSLIYLIALGNDIFVMSLSDILFTDTLDGAVNTGIFGFITMGLLFYLVSIIAQNLRSIGRVNTLNMIFWVSTFAIPLISIYLTVIVLSLSGKSDFIVISAIIAIFTINILAFYLHDLLSKSFEDKLKAILNEKEKEYYFSQCHLMQDSLEDFKSFRHEFVNYLSALGEYINHGQLDNASNYVNTLIGNVATDVGYSKTGNIAFDSIINYKLRDVKESGIMTLVDVMVPSNLNIEVSDVAVILGNLLDNAIYAASKSEAKQLSLQISYNKGRLIIHLENSFAGKIVSLSGELLSSKRNYQSLGYGLKNIRKSIEKYSGIINITHSDNLFSSRLLLYINHD
ncbi:MAG: GHKL domain-containing protein [Lachnospiraceae bacterium]|nr:GHKL domain-containing protein [Lachnospiraceae bacterium]